ncbi:hypothetical protein ACHAXS_006624 [Conticribra weissflogii]
MMSTEDTANSNPLSALADLAAMSEIERAASRTSTSSSMGVSLSRTNSPGQNDRRAAELEKEASSGHSDDSPVGSKDDDPRNAMTAEDKEVEVKMEEEMEMDLELELVNQEHPSSSSSSSPADHDHPHDCHEVSHESLFSSSSSLLSSSINNININSNDNSEDGNRRSIASEEQKLFRQRKKEMKRRPAKKRAVPSDLDMGFGMTVHPNIAAAAAAATSVKGSACNSGKVGGSSSSPSFSSRGAGGGDSPSSKSNCSKGGDGNSVKPVKANVKFSPHSPNNIKTALNSNGTPDSSNNNKGEIASSCRRHDNPKKKKSDCLINSNSHGHPPKKIKSKKSSHPNKNNHNNHSGMGPPPAFPVILMAILSSPHTEDNQTNVSDVISFLSDNQSFIVVNPMILEQEILPKHFGDYRHGHPYGNSNNDNVNGNRKIETFHEFQQTLLYWGFTCDSDPKYPKVNVWKHPMFRKGDWEECLKITLPQHPHLRFDHGDNGTYENVKEAGAGSINGRDGNYPKKFPPKASSVGSNPVKRPLYREYFSQCDSDEFGHRQFLQGHVRHQHQRPQQPQQHQHPQLAQAQQDHLQQQRHQQHPQPQRDRPESPPRGEDQEEHEEANERHRNPQMMDHNARSVTPSGESIDGERRSSNASGVNHSNKHPHAATNAAVSAEAAQAHFDSSSTQLESVKQAVLRRAMAMEASSAFCRRHSDLMLSATQNMNLMYPTVRGSNDCGMTIGAADSTAAKDLQRLRLERDYQTMDDVELQEYRRQLLLEREHCLRASLGLGYIGRPSESTMTNKMGFIRRGPIFTGGSGHGMANETNHRGMMGYGGNNGDPIEAASVISAIPRRYSALGGQSSYDHNGMLNSSPRLSSHPYNGASESLLSSSRWNPRERSSSMPLGMQSYHRHDGMMPQPGAPSDEDVKMATEDVVSAALDVLRRGEAAQQQQQEQQQIFQTQLQLNQQRPQQRGPRPRCFQRSRRHTVDHVPSNMGGMNSGFANTTSSSTTVGAQHAMNPTSASMSLDAMTEEFLERSRARLSGRPMGISAPSTSMLASTSSSSAYETDPSATRSTASDTNQFSGKTDMSGGAYFSSYRKSNDDGVTYSDGTTGSGGVTSNMGNGESVMNGMMPSRDSLMASVGAEVDAQARAILAYRRASMGL